MGKVVAAVGMKGKTVSKVMKDLKMSSRLAKSRVFQDMTKAMKPVKAAGAWRKLTTPMKIMTAVGMQEKNVPNAMKDLKMPSRLAKSGVSRGAMKTSQVITKVMQPFKAAAAWRKLTTPMKVMTVVGMKEKKVSKAMKDLKTSSRLEKSKVFHGAKEKTSGGLKKADLTKTKSGKVVSKQVSANAMKWYAPTLGKWTKACMMARELLGIEGFVPVRKGSALYKKSRELYTA